MRFREQTRVVKNKRTITADAALLTHAATIHTLQLGVDRSSLPAARLNPLRRTLHRRWNLDRSERRTVWDGVRRRRWRLGRCRDLAWGVAAAEGGTEARWSVGTRCPAFCQVDSASSAFRRSQADRCGAASSVNIHHQHHHHHHHHHL